jgi:hypothetical protein
MLQIDGKGFANVGRQRQPGPPSTLTPNCDLALVCVEDGAPGCFAAGEAEYSAL